MILISIKLHLGFFLCLPPVVKILTSDIAWQTYFAKQYQKLPKKNRFFLFPNNFPIFVQWWTMQKG